MIQELWAPAGTLHLAAAPITKHIAELILQIAVILLAAKISGEICDRYLRVPSVLGELGAGLLIGPFALGGIQIGGFGPLFDVAHLNSTNILEAIPSEIYFLAQLASVVLLFGAGLETDLKQFMRYAGPATVIALGGVVFPFVFGVVATVSLGYAPDFTSPVALFIGALMTATSVGITARVLADLHQLSSPEGVTIIGAAVIDDILGILILTIVIGVSGTEEPSLGKLGLIAGKALGFWVLLTGILLLLSKKIFRVIDWFRIPGAPIVLALSLALIGAGLAEMAGLAMIIGAYSVGLALSETNLGRTIEESLEGVHSFVVPIFFAVMGMMVNLPSMTEALLFGSVLTVLAIISKVFGCGLPAMATGFNSLGGLRIGLGMLPRGEVALIIAGVGLAANVIDGEMFGVAVMITIVTTILAPILLVPAFKIDKPGRKPPQVKGNPNEALS